MLFLEKWSKNFADLTIRLPRGSHSWNSTDTVSGLILAENPPLPENPPLLRDLRLPRYGILGGLTPKFSPAALCKGVFINKNSMISPCISY